MIRKTILALLLLSAQTAFSQKEHQRNSRACKFYIPVPVTKNSAMPEAWLYCTPCREVQQEENRRLAEMYKKQEEARLAKYEAEKAKRAAQVKADQEAIERRNNVANTKLKNIQAQDARLTDQWRQQQQRDKAINDKYNKLNEQNLKEYQSFMEQLKQVPAEKTSQSSDPFWNETVQLAGYEPFYDGSKRLYGFKDKHGNTRLSPRYTKAVGFAGGAAYVIYDQDEKRAPGIINPKGEELFAFHPAVFKQYSEKANARLDYGNIVHASSNGVFAMLFWGEHPQLGRGGFYGLINKKGELVSNNLYNQIDSFKNGRAVAHRTLKQEQYYSDYSENRWVYFKYVETGVIDTRGAWVETPKKIMQIGEDRRITGGITITSRDAPRKTDAEERAEKAAQELRERERSQKMWAQFNAEIKRRSDAAISQGYLIDQKK